MTASLRFIALDWANYALTLALRAGSHTARVSTLKDWLAVHLAGKDATRKTANVLSRLWLDNNPNNEYFQHQALKLGLDVEKEDLVILHWGMALFTFPFFSEICTQVGRLLALQETITRREIQVRMAEKYSNQGTVPRSVDRVLQSLVDWGVLQKRSPQTLAAKQHPSSDILLKQWLLECVIFSAPQQRILVQGMYRLPVLFPFQYNGEIEKIISQSCKVKIERDGNNFEYAAWKES